MSRNENAGPHRLIWRALISFYGYLDPVRFPEKLSCLNVENVITRCPNNTPEGRTRSQDSPRTMNK